MKQNRSILDEKISMLLAKQYTNGLYTTLLTKAEAELHGLINGRLLTQIFITKKPINTLTEDVLYNLARFLENNISVDFKVDNFFTPNEMEKYSVQDEHFDNSTLLEIQTLHYFDNMNKEWLCTLTYKEIYNMWKNSKIQYDTSIQRSATQKTFKNEVVELATFNKKSVNDISKAMLNKTFSTNMITLNIVHTGEEEFITDSNGVLTIDLSKSIVAIIDGGHRCVAIEKAIGENPKLEGSMVVIIKNLDKEGCRKFIKQEAMANKHDDVTLSKFDQNDKITRLINELNTYRNRETNPLFNNIESIFNDNENCLIKEDILRIGIKASGIDDLLKNMVGTESLNFKQHIADFYEKLFRIYKEKYGEINKDEFSLINNQLFIANMLCVFKVMYDKTKSTDDKMIIDLVDKVDFDNEESKYLIEMTNTTAVIKKMRDITKKLV